MMYREYESEIGLWVLLPEQIFDEMKEVCRLYYPRESGGVLVGHIENGHIAIVERMIVPRRFYSTPSLFRRKQAFVNRKLRKIWEDSAGAIHYLGEWHCHPNMTSDYSGTDFQAMADIAADRENRMDNPIMMIIGFKPPEFKETLYVFFNGTLKTYKLKP